MVDYNKVINGLKCCIRMGNMCKKCPYEAGCRDTDLLYGMWHLMNDVLEILEAYKKEIEDLTCVCDDFMSGAMYP